MTVPALRAALLAELARPERIKRFGPSSWELRDLLARAGIAVDHAAIVAELLAMREEGLVRFQAPPVPHPPHLGNVRITPAGQELARRTSEEH